MKKISIAFIILLTVTLSSCIMDGLNQGITGNGNVLEETRDLSGFDRIHISSGIDVLLSEGEDFGVRVEADENLMEVIETKLTGSTLEVGTDKVNIRSAKSRKVHVTMPELKVLKISSAGDCYGQTPFHCGDLRISISSAGDLKIEVDAKRIDLDMSSSGDARISGSAEEFKVNISSAGDLHAFDLVAGRVDVDVSSAGDARVHAT